MPTIFKVLRSKSDDAFVESLAAESEERWEVKKFAIGSDGELVALLQKTEPVGTATVTAALPGLRI